MKLVLFLFVVIVCILAYFGIRAFINGVKLHHTLITYNGRTCSYWEARLWPDEYIHGWVFETAKLSPKIGVRTGIDQGITPPQAAAVIDWILENYPVSSSGASITNRNETEYDEQNRQLKIIWRFDKPPSRGITKKTQKKMIDDLLHYYQYMLVDKWPLKPEKYIDDNQKKAKEIIFRDLYQRGL